MSAASASSSLGSATSPPAAPTAPGSQTINVIVAGGKVTPKPGRVKVQLGKPVTLQVTSDVADEVHVHSYDLKRDVPAGGTATLTFTADLPGLFEVELESRGLRLLELQVS